MKTDSVHEIILIGRFTVDCCFDIASKRSNNNEKSTFRHFLPKRQGVLGVCRGVRWILVETTPRDSVRLDSMGF